MVLPEREAEDSDPGIVNRLVAAGEELHHALGDIGTHSVVDPAAG